MATPGEVRDKLVAALGEEAVAASEAANELRKFSVATKSIAARQKQFGENLINSGIPLIKFTGTMVKTLSSYNANIKLAQKQQETNQQKLNALEAKRQAQIDKLTLATTEQEKRKAALKLQATLDSIEATKLDTNQQKESVRALKSARIGDVVQQTAKSMKETGQAFTKLTTSLNKTQKDFGIGIGGAATLRANVMIDTVKDTAEILSKVDLGAAASAMMDLASGLGNATLALGTGKGINQAVSELNEGLRKANTPIGGPPLDQILLPSERLEGMRELQSEFGVMNATLGKSLAQTAKNYGVSVQQLVQARRAFVTITNGDLSKVDTLQNKFFATFKQAGMERRIALEAITKYADIIARNGTRFADSFARAAADAKRIGVDLSKVEQFGDNIIDNFEGFLESQAELGAMGFGFDSSRLAEIAATGDTGALYKELRSQLSMMGKDINNLTRPERLSLEGMGIDIATMQRMAGGTPQISPEDIAKDNNTKLTQLLILAQIGGPLLGPLGKMAEGITSVISALGPYGSIATLVLGIGLWLKYKGDEDKIEREKLKARGELYLEQGNIAEGAKLLREYARKEAAVMTFQGGPAGYAQSNKLTDEIESKIRGYELRAVGQENVLKGTLEKLNIQQGPLSPNRQINQGLNRFPQAFPNVAPAVKRMEVDWMGTPIPQKKASGGVISGPGTGTSDSIPAMLSNGEYVLPATLVSAIGVDNLDKLRSIVGGSDYFKLVEALLSGNFKEAGKYLKTLGQEEALEMILRRTAGFTNMGAMAAVNAGSDVLRTYQENKDKPYATYWSTTKPGELPSWVPRKKDGGLVGKLKSTAMSKGMGFLSNKVPGFSSAMNVFSDYKTGGVKGALGSLAKGDIGKMIGGALGSAIPIPGIGTAIGSLMGSKVGKLVGGLFGRRKQPIAQQLAGALPGMAGFAGNLMGRIPGMERFNPEGLFRGMADRPQAQAAVQAVVDTTGIEQKLNNFVNALNNMNIVMDGAKVGKVLVNVTDAANTVGVFRPATRATL